MKKILFILRLIIAIAIAVNPELAFAEVQSISLKSGFNFISFTVKPSITPQNLKIQNPAIEDIYLYSAAAGSFLSVNEGALTSFGIGKGYIIKSNSQFSINIEGEAAVGSPCSETVRNHGYLSFEHGLTSYMPLSGPGFHNGK